MKLLTYQSYRNTCGWVLMMAMDAAACYYQILAYIYNICERQYGLPKTACFTDRKTFFEILHQVRTAYRESEELYTSVTKDILDLIQRECQRKTSYPPSCAIYTITLLRILTHYNL